MKWTGLLVALAALAVAAGPFGCSEQQEETATPAAASGDGDSGGGMEAPAFTLEDQAGNEVSLSDHAGEIVVLEWINWDCPFVQRHYKAGTMKTLAEEYADDGVVWLAINSTHYATQDKDGQWIEQYDLPYRILHDPTGEVGKAYGARTTPHMYIVDGDGMLVYQGAIDDDPGGDKDNPTNYVRRALDELLAGEEVSTAETKPYGCSVKYAK
jgi:peroxiredoxin